MNIPIWKGCSSFLLTVSITSVSLDESFRTWKILAVEGVLDRDEGEGLEGLDGEEVVGSDILICCGKEQRDVKVECGWWKERRSSFRCDCMAERECVE